MSWLFISTMLVLMHLIFYIQSTKFLLKSLRGQRQRLHSPSCHGFQQHDTNRFYQDTNFEKKT